MTWSPSLGVGELHFVGREDGQFCETLNGFTVESESLAGKRYRSNFNTTEYGVENAIREVVKSSRRSGRRWPRELFEA